MSTLEANMALLLTIPEERQEEIQSYLLTNFCTDNPYGPLSSSEIIAELDESRAYVFYTVETLRNRQAAKAILADARETKKRLSMAADSLKICDNPILAEYGYRKIKFARHKFVMLYRIQ